MGSSEQAIRVTAQGEFGQLQRGLKDLQGDLKGVLGEIDKGARRGGFFDDDSLRALDLYRRRFKDTLNDLNTEFEKQGQAIDSLNEKMKKASMWEKDDILQQIRRREAELDVINRTRQALEDTYRRRNTEAQGYGSPTPSVPNGGTGSGSESGLAMMGVGSVIPKALGAVSMIGKFALGLAGVTSLLGMASEAYQLAKTREVGSLDLAQRLRGNGFSGTNSQMYDEVGAVGRSNRMGYTSPESWAVQEAYTSQAGTLGAEGQLALQKFSRGYGLDATSVGGMAGNTKQLGGTSTPKQFADMIATSVEKSGMTPRILEVMKTHSTLLQSLNTTFKDGSSSQIMAYQTTLDRLGNENGMTRLTGAQGANVIGGLGGIFEPGDDKWKWTGISALKAYDPKKYKDKSLYDMESSFEDGIQNPDNIPAMAKYLKASSGGNNDTFKRMMQQWLMDGGFKATKSEVTELDKVTEGFTAFDPDKIDKVLGKDSGSKYENERKDSEGQRIQNIDAEFSKSLEVFGQKILPVVTTMKEDINGIFRALQGEEGVKAVTEEVLQFLKDSGLGTVAKMLAVGYGGRKAYDIWKGRNTETGLPGEETPSEETARGRTARGRTARGRTARERAGEERLRQADEVAVARDTESTGAKGPTTNEPLTNGQAEMLDGVAEENGVNRSNLEKAYRANGDAGIEEFLRTGKPPTETTGATPVRETTSAGPVRSTPSEGAVPRVTGISGGMGGFLKGIAPVIGNVAMVGMAVDLYLQYKNQKPLTAEQIKASKGVVESAGLNLSSFPGLVTDADMTPGEKLKQGLKLSPEETTKALESLATNGELALDGFSTFGKSQLEKLQADGLLQFTDLKTSTTATVSNLSTAGTQSLLDLQTKGLISIGGLQKDGTAQVTALNEDGKASLEKLKTSGTIEMSDFNKVGKVQVTSLSEEGSKRLQELKKNGSLTLEGMSTDSTAKLELMRKDTETTNANIFLEHKGIGDRIAEFFKPLTDLWNKLLSKFGFGDSDILSGGSKNANSDVRQMSGATASSLNDKLKGKLGGYGDDYMTAGKKYGIDPAFLASISMQETGNGKTVSGNNVGGMMGSHGLMKFDSITEGIDAMAKNLYNLYIQQGLTTPAEIQKKYSPIGAENDPTGLNNNWLKGVTSFYGQMAGNNGSGGSVFANWQDKITSPYGADRGDHKHTGLDIDGTQGDTLNALAGGKITNLQMDDGGKYDADGKKNTRMGGTEMVVTMPNGKKYSYSHMSKVNADILAEWESGNHSIDVGAGDNLGAMGGDPGMAGSGYSTTGSHLHLGYQDANGNMQNPEDLLKSLNAGDSNILSSNTSDASNSVPPKEQKITIDVNLKGEGVSQLNSMTVDNLKALIQQGIEAYKRQQLAMNPVSTGW